MTPPNLLPPGYEDTWENQANRLTHLRDIGFSPRSILDIGAYHGTWAGLAHWIWPKAYLCLLEADEDCRPMLDAQEHQYEIVLLDKEERLADFYKCTAGTGEGNGLYPEAGPVPFTKVKLPTRRLDDVLKDEQYDFVKIDCQGAELDILRGGTHILAGAKMLLLETQVQEYNRGAPFMLDVLNCLSFLGWKLYDIIEPHYSLDARLAQLDVLLAPSKSAFFC